MWCIKGRIVPMASDRSVAASSATTFAGRVWIADDGTIAAVTRGRAAGPAGSAGARWSTSARRWSCPGLVDLHNHLAYNTLPLWTEPPRRRPGRTTTPGPGRRRTPRRRPGRRTP